MRLVFMGTPDFALPTLEELIARGHEIALVVTKEDAIVGRGQKVRFSPVKEKALEAGLPLLQPRSLKKDPEAAEAIRRAAPEAIVVVAYGHLLPREILEIPPCGCLNVHASLLPRHRGAAPVQWAILSGDEESGVSIMRMDEGMDTGDVYARWSTPIGSMDAEALGDCLSRAGAELLCDTLEALAAGSTVPVPQEEEGASYAPMIRKEDGHLDFRCSAEEAERRIRAFSPWPGCFAYLGEESLKLWKGEPLMEPHEGAPGQVLGATEEGIFLACEEGILRLTELQLAGKKRMEAAAFLRGRSIEIGTLLR